MPADKLKRSSGLKTDRFWLIVFGLVVAVSVITASLLGRTPANRVSIYRDGILTESVNLNAITEPYTIEVIGNNSNGGFNVLEVEPGRIRMQKADCPDKTCLRQGWVSDGVIPIVCLPNRVVVTLESENTDIDAMVG